MFVSTRDHVLLLLAAGATQAEVARRLKVTKSTVTYHARRAHPPDPKFRRRYDWSEVQAYYDLGHSITECQRRFGFARKTFFDAWKSGRVVTRPQAMPLAALLVIGRRTNRRHLRLRLLAAGLKEDRCERCRHDGWCGEPLGMQLHHVNGNGLDNRLENLMLLCPNCHSLTETWGGRNKGRGARAS
jgi:hypothetical protein